MIVETKKLTGPALDWVVAKAMGKNPKISIFHQTGNLAPKYRYSTEWAQGGPVIEAKHIQVTPVMAAYGLRWDACSGPTDDDVRGPTPLIAAMRCVATNKFGDRVDIPNELL